LSTLAVSARLRLLIVALAALAAALATARLGWWQLDRAAQKNALQRSVDERARMAPLDGNALARDAAAALSQHHRPVLLTGHWSATHTVFLDNRQLGDGRPGFFVVTPLRLADGRAVLVQRGWVARDGRERTRLPQIVTPEGEVRLAGRIAPPPARLYQFEVQEHGRIRQNLDVDGFARETGLALAPLSVLQTAPAVPEDDASLRRDWPAPASGVAKHHGYAFQWFALSALVVFLYVWFQFIQPRRRRAESSA
jgi:surfeit locus 1 family protein